MHLPNVLLKSLDALSTNRDIDLVGLEKRDDLGVFECSISDSTPELLNL